MCVHARGMRPFVQYVYALRSARTAHRRRRLRVFSREGNIQAELTPWRKSEKQKRQKSQSELALFWRKLPTTTRPPGNSGVLIGFCLSVCCFSAKRCEFSLIRLTIHLAPTPLTAIRFSIPREDCGNWSARLIENARNAKHIAKSARVSVGRCLTRRRRRRSSSTSLVRTIWRNERMKRLLLRPYLSARSGRRALTSETRIRT